MKLFPYHDVNGKLFPELDTREVGVQLMCDYLSVHRFTVWDRAQTGEFGRTPAEGAWFAKSRHGRTGGRWKFRPATLWRRKMWGRFAAIGFDPMALETRVRIFACDPTETAKQQQAQPLTSPEFAQAFTHMSGALMEALALCRKVHPNQQNISFTQEG